MNPLRFFADHCIANSVVESLQRNGHDLIRLGDILPTSAPDIEVIRAAPSERAILLTLNGDFADIVAYPPADYGGVSSPSASATTRK